MSVECCGEASAKGADSSQLLVLALTALNALREANGQRYATSGNKPATNRWRMQLTFSQAACRQRTPLDWLAQRPHCQPAAIASNLPNFSETLRPPTALEIFLNASERNADSIASPIGS